MTVSGELILGIILCGLLLFTIMSLGSVFLFYTNPFAGTMYLTVHLIVGLGVRLSFPDFNFDIPVKWPFLGDKEWILHVSSGGRTFAYFLLVVTVFVFASSSVGYLMTVLGVPKAPSLLTRLGMLRQQVASIWRKPPAKAQRGSRKKPLQDGEDVAAAGGGAARGRGAGPGAAASQDCNCDVERVAIPLSSVAAQAAMVQASVAGEAGEASPPAEKPDAG